MKRILCVLGSLEYSGAAKQVSLLAAGLPRDQFAVRVCALGGAGRVAEKLRAAGVQVDALGGTRLVNLAALWHLRCLIRNARPDVIHAWGRSSVRMVALAAKRGVSKVLVSNPFSPKDKRATLGRLDRWLLRGVDKVVALGPAEAERCRRVGLPMEKINVVLPGVETITDCRLPIADLNAVSGNRLVVCAGPLEPHKGFRDAIWAFDILQFLYDDVRLLVVGTGSYRKRLEQFAEATGAGRKVHFTGPVPDLPQVLAKAEVVWVPSLTESGMNVALEAMALGRPVVASRLPGLAEIIVNGKTGFLVTPGNKVELARQTRLLLDDAERRRQMGEGARSWVSVHFSTADLLRRYAELYSMKKAA
jgi:glycosyltransferase involved in cell wall biosynthesis